MFEFAAFGFVALTWWTWPAIAGIVFASMWLVLWLDTRKQKRAEADSGPYPCLAHLGTDPEGSHSWCGQLEGHDGPHGVWAIDALQWPAMDPDPINDVVCLRSSNCYLRNDHEGECQLDYSR